MSIYQPSKTVLLNAINTQNSIAVRAIDIVYSAPKEIRGTDKGNTTGKNTQIKVTGTGAGWSGKKNVYYNRLDIADLVVLLGNTLALGPSNSTLYEALSALNIRYGFVFDTTDLLDAEILWDAERTSGTVVLKAQENSVGWIGQHNFSVVKGDESLAIKVTTTVLSGLKYPNDQMGSESIGYSIAHVYSYPLNFTPHRDKLLEMPVGVLSGENLTTMVGILNAVNPPSWTATNSATWGLLGAEVLSVGDNSPATMPTNAKYTYVLALKMPATNTRIRGTMYLQFNDPEDPNEV